MKRIILLSICLVLGFGFTFSQKFRIKSLNTESIKIGDKVLKKEQDFVANEKIYWNKKGQSMRLMFLDGEKRGLPIMVRREALERIGAESVAEYLCWSNQNWFDKFKSSFVVKGKTSSRGSSDLMEKTASNFPEKRLALVIGNSNYEHLEPLANPLNDVAKVTEKLQSLGFDVLPVYDADIREFNRNLKWLRAHKDYDVVIVYYSGHGSQDEKKQYLVPIDVALEEKTDLFDCISLENVYESLNALGGDKTKLVFVDACRIQGRWQSKVETNSEEEAKDIAVFFSTSDGEKASDGEAGENSPFALAFLEEIGKPADNVATTIGNIKNAVKRNSNQIPFESNFTGMNFSFNPHLADNGQQGGISLKTDYDELCSVAAGELEETEVGYSAWFNGGAGFHGACINVDINSSVNTLRDGAFKDCSGIESISIPASVTKIGKRIFKDSRSYLSSIEISPDNLFYDSRDNCNAIIEKATNTLIEGCQFTEIPNSVTKIGDYAFEDCDQLENITIPNSITEIGNFAFSGCTRLSKIEIPTSVTSIGDGAFSGCDLLDSITIPSSVTSIGDGAFSGCTRLKFINIPNTIEEIKDSTFSKCIGIERITIPSSTTSIGDAAFYGCKGLKDIIIPNSVTEIGDYAFRDCKKLESIIIPKSVTRISKGIFDNCSELSTIIIPETIEEIGDNAFSDCKKLESIIIPESVSSIGDFAFSNCEELESITIPKSVMWIGQGAFIRCTNLTNITIPKSVTSIGGSAFKGTTWFEKQPDGLIYVGRVAYKYKGIMPEGSTIAIKDGTISIADNAFERCYGLKSVTIPKSVTEIGEEAFSGCTGLERIDIPKSVTSIGRHAFNDTPWFERQPEGLIYIGRVAYKYKGIMPEGSIATIKDGTVSIADGAFYECTGLESISLPKTVENIEDNAFYLTGLKSITIPKSVMWIGNCALMSCWQLKSITISNSEMWVGEAVFNNCESFEDVYIKVETTPEYGWIFSDDEVFRRCILHVPKGCKEAYEEEEPWCTFKEIVDDL